MKLREYIEASSGEPLGLCNRLVKRLAMMTLSSKHTIYSIALGRRFASKRLAREIQRATKNIVTVKELVNEHPQKRGPKPRPARP